MRPCPACGGQHLRDLVYQHATACRIYAADGATVNNDHINREGIRPARNHERELINAQDYHDPAAGHEYGIRFDHAGGVHRRDVVILDGAGGYVIDGTRP